MTEYYPGKPLKVCPLCGRRRLLALSLGVCVYCIRERFSETRPLIEKAHRESRKDFGFPLEPPRSKEGVQCNQCVQQCQIPPGGYGFCGLRKNESGRLIHLFGVDDGLLDWYYDPIPTNCVAAWVCGARGRGYPEFSISKGTEFGRKNLAVFYRACSFNCLYCQNWHFKEKATPLSQFSSDELAECVDPYTTCICYFGGDPAPQIHHSLLVAQKATKRGRILRICWETNGSENPKIMKKMAQVAKKSGGTIKIDLKALNPNLHWAFTFASNSWTLENIRILAELSKERREPPLLVVSTLLVPGYVDSEEVRSIAEFLSSLDPGIPFSLLGFHPHFLLHDLPRTSRAHAEEALRVAKESGLKEVKIGNIHLLW